MSSSSLMATQSSPLHRGSAEYSCMHVLRSSRACRDEWTVHHCASRRGRPAPLLQGDDVVLRLLKRCSSYCLQRFSDVALVQMTQLRGIHTAAIQAWSHEQ